MTATLDLLHDPGRLPRLRTVSMTAAWAGLETLGIGMSTALWAAGRAGDVDAHYTLQRWWALRLIDTMRMFANVQLQVSNLDAVAPGPVVLAARHASIADVLLPVWLLAQHDMRPRYVLKRELLIDPCLDIVGNRVPNHFVVRKGDAAAAELDALRAMAAGMGPRDGAVIYPEGGIANDPRRAAELARLAERDPDRADQLKTLGRLLPPRYAGLWAILSGSPDADLVFVDHTGLEVINKIRRAPGQIPFRSPIQVTLHRVRRADIPDTLNAFKIWLDDAWLNLDRQSTG
ncbi:MAG: 1-acyl-sn-glycerol-3-phosphate acyltransferase [Actinomycetia bacterium]|nr:1-acyl-sn-glycerol-3-phosphate acyltransferase [Actinomycetes bacterium]